jgi:uncharacterized protein YejL (UPF0352 family)
MTTPLELSKFENVKTEKSSQEKKEPTPFDKKLFKKKQLPKGISDQSLETLKAALEKHKQDQEVAGTGFISFGNMTTNQVQNNSAAAKVGKMEPSAQVMQLFSKLADSLIHMDNAGIKETTITLGNAFASSIFKGGRVTITEYSTAPKIFNVRFTGSTEAINFFEVHKENMKHSFNGGNFSFRLHTVDTSLISDENNDLIEPVKNQEEEE